MHEVNELVLTYLCNFKNFSYDAAIKFLKSNKLDEKKQNNFFLFQGKKKKNKNGELKETLNSN